MTSFSVNISIGVVRFSYQRLFRFSSVVSSFPICCCAEVRSYSSSFPVKYIPKKSRQQNENAVGTSDGLSYSPATDFGNAITGLGLNLSRDSSSSQRNPKRSFLDTEPQNDDLRCSSTSIACITSDEEEIDVNLSSENDEYMKHRDERVKNSNQIRDENTVSENLQVAEKMAIHLLASRAFTVSELKKKLQSKRFTPNIVDAVVSDFQHRGLVNDCLYAESYCQSRWSSSSWGPIKIRQGLLRKGVSVENADKAITLFFNKNKDDDDDDDDDDDMGKRSLSKVCIDELYLEASKQWKRSSGASPETRKSRIVRWLQYRGFNWSVVGYILKKLDSQPSSSFAE